MKITFIILIIAAVVTITGSTSEPQESPTLDYSGPAVTGNLAKGYQKTTVKEIEKFINNKLQVPAYLPTDYEIQEVYHKYHPENSPPTTSIYLLISDQSVEWKDSQFLCRLFIDIEWDKASLGLKMPWARSIVEAGGKLEETEDKYILWKESYGDKISSTVKICTSRDFPLDELIKIAASIPHETD